MCYYDFMSTFQHANIGFQQQFFNFLLVEKTCSTLRMDWRQASKQFFAGYVVELVVVLQEYLLITLFGYSLIQFSPSFQLALSWCTPHKKQFTVSSGCTVRTSPFSNPPVQLLLPHSPPLLAAAIEFSTLYVLCLSNQLPPELFSHKSSR